MSHDDYVSITCYQPVKQDEAFYSHFNVTGKINEMEKRYFTQRQMKLGDII